MKHARRKFLHLVASATTLTIVSRIAAAQTYPAGPVRLIVPGSPGGTADLFARLYGEWLAQRLNHPFIIENRVGAGGNNLRKLAKSIDGRQPVIGRQDHHVHAATEEQGIIRKIIS